MTEILKILTINPGSTSTKVACFEELRCISSISLQHSPEELSAYGSVMEQYAFRKQAVLGYILQQKIRADGLHAVVGRGGLLRPLKGGTYRVNTPMLEDLKGRKYGEHASNLGAVIAYEIASQVNIPSFIVNPVVVDEMEPLSRYSGLALIQRKSVFHALNQKAAAMRAAESLGKSYSGVNLVVAHMGGGISVAAHKNGRVVDVNNALEEGAFSPERTGSLPVQQLMELCFSGGYTKDEVKRLLVGRGGLVSYLGTSDCREVESRIAAGDKEAEDVLSAMVYGIAKEIGAYSTVMCGRVDAIVLTGGLAHSRFITDGIEEKVGFIAPVMVFSGEDEMQAMAEGAYRVLTGGEKALEYT